MRTSRKVILPAVLIAVGAVVGVAQFRDGGGRGRFREYWGDEGDTGPMVLTEGRRHWVNEDTVRTARETPQHSEDGGATPAWTNAPGFEKDVFTFTRVIFKSNFANSWRPTGHWFGWVNDYPDADLNLSWRLSQLTSMKVDPDGRVLKLTDPGLSDYPMIHMAKPGRMVLRDEEVEALRNYLLVGGTLMADDFWGAEEWDNFEAQMKRVLPGHSWVELPMEHPLFHCVFDLNVPKNKLQVPFVRYGRASLNPDSPNYGNTAQYGGEDHQDVHVRAWLDEKQRIMIIATHNTNNGDGWEREGEHLGYFHTFSETRAYPLAINIIFYVMTH